MPHCSVQHKMQPITCMIAWSLCVSVCLPVLVIGVNPAKSAEPIEIAIWGVDFLAQGTVYYVVA